MLQNRAFQQVTPGLLFILAAKNKDSNLSRKGTTAALAGWLASNSTIAVVAETSPISSALPNALELTFPAGAVSGVGFVNTGNSGEELLLLSGYSMKFILSSAGFHIATQTQHKASFSYRFPTSVNFRGSLIVTLQDGVGTILASQSVPISGSQTTWKAVQVTLSTNIVSGSDANLFGISVEGEGNAKALRFAMLSLFPPTFKGRENGMRIDIAEVRTNILLL